MRSTAASTRPNASLRGVNGFRPPDSTAPSHFGKTSDNDCSTPAEGPEREVQKFAVFKITRLAKSAGRDRRRAPAVENVVLAFGELRPVSHASLTSRAERLERPE
jgi:hypothetical protein